MKTRPKELLEKAILLNPDLADAHFQLGILHKSENNSDLAVESFKKAVEINCEFPEAECQLAMELANLEQIEDARKQ